MFLGAAGNLLVYVKLYGRYRLVHLYHLAWGLSSTLMVFFLNRSLTHCETVFISVIGLSFLLISSISSWWRSKLKINVHAYLHVLCSLYLTLGSLNDHRLFVGHFWLLE